MMFVLRYYRYALTLRLMLANLRRKIGLATHTHTPQPPANAPAANSDGTLVVPSNFVENATGGTPLPPLTIEELGFVWPADGGIFSPSSVPIWLQEQVGLHCWLLLAPKSGFFTPSPHFPESWRSGSTRQRFRRYIPKREWSQRLEW